MSVAACLAMTVALAACTAPAPATTPPATAPGVTATPEPTPTPTPTVAPEAVKPEVPEAMSDPGTEGAVAAAQYFLSLYPYVYATGDLAAWQAMSHPECVFCASVVTNVQAQVAAGQHSEGGVLTLSLEGGIEVANRTQSITLDAVQEAARTLGPDGELVGEAAAAHYRVTAVMVPGDPWTVRGIDVEPAADAG